MVSSLLPNVKDEPRRELARRVPHSELDSNPSFRSPFGRTRRDSSRRWLWRLVGRLSSGAEVSILSDRAISDRYTYNDTVFGSIIEPSEYRNQPALRHALRRFEASFCCPNLASLNFSDCDCVRIQCTDLRTSLTHFPFPQLQLKRLISFTEHEYFQFGAELDDSIPRELATDLNPSRRFFQSRVRYCESSVISNRPIAHELRRATERHHCEKE